VREKKVVYGITTGFGNFAHVSIDAADVEQLQYNLVTSHAAGVGSPMSLERALSLMVLRINTLAKGHSGVRPETLQHMLNCFNRRCVPFVPEQGSVGASGDLAPLAHQACGLLGVGKMWDQRTGTWGSAAEILALHGLAPIRLSAKEGLSMINGTQFITSLAAEAIGRCETLVRVADIVAAFTLEALQGSFKAFDPRIHASRPHHGQGLVARRVRALLHSQHMPSEISEQHKHCNKVQDSYTLRCIPQVHGVVNDTLAFVRGVIETEMNSATDNPMVFPDPANEGQGDIVSGGNFHGEYPAKVLDYLAVAIHELSNISERRIERLVNPALSELPAFLTPNGGLNSGFMIAQVTAAALVSENKTLCHPASVDSIPTSANKEDHVSMGAWAARKCISVVRNVENVIGIELMCSAQAIDFLRPLKTTEPLEKVYAAVREVIPTWDKDRFVSPDIEAACSLVKSGELISLVEPWWLEVERHQPSTPHNHW
jgi:histidine ammonia-lyase